MKFHKTIKQLLKERDNDYSLFEPFNDSTPISSSIIIPVYNGGNIFRETVKNLSKHPTITSKHNLFEIIVVNDGSTENIESILKDIEFPCQFKYFSFPQNKGRSAARNKGIRLASNSLLFFFDADILLPNNYFEEMWKIHNATKKAVAVGLAENIFFDDPKLTKLIKAEDFFPNIKDDFRYYKKFSKGEFDRGEYQLIKETNWFKQFGNHEQIGPWTLPKMVVTHNVSVRKENANQIKGFDERFRTWGYEDTYFGAKLIASGCYVIPSKNTGIIRIIIRNKNKRFSDKNRSLYEKLIAEEKLP